MTPPPLKPDGTVEWPEGGGTPDRPLAPGRQVSGADIPAMVEGRPQVDLPHYHTADEVKWFARERVLTVVPVSGDQD